MKLSLKEIVINLEKFTMDAGQKLLSFQSNAEHKLVDRKICKDNKDDIVKILKSENL